MPRTFALLLATVLASPAVAARPRIVVLPFTGPGANAARNQVVGALCDSATCVPAAKVGNSNKPNWKKLKKERVTFIVLGNIAKAKNRKLSLEVVVMKGPGKPRLRKFFPVDGKSRLGEAATESMGEAVLTTLGVSAERKQPEPVAEPEPPARPEPVAARTKPEPEPESRPAEKSDDPWTRTTAASSSSSSGEVTQTPDEPYRPKRKDPIFAVEVGPDLFARRFAYSNVATNNLRSYSANLVVAPRLKAELYPLAAMTRGMATGLGLELGYSLAVGLQSKRTDGPSHPTSLTRLDVGAMMRIKPGSSDAAIIPSVGFRSTSFAVGLAPDGSKLDGLPGISYSALVLGVGAEVPVDDDIKLFAKLAYMPVFSSGEIISPAYFPNGGASGFEVAAGGGYRVIPSVEVRVTGLFTRYGLSFTTAEGDPYVAAGASDMYFGANLSARYSY